MADLASLIQQNLLYLIIAIIVVVVIIGVLLLRRRRSKAKDESINSIKYFEKQAELKKRELVNKSIGEPTTKHVNMNPILREREKKLNKIHEGNDELMHRINFLNDQVELKVSKLEERREYRRLEKLLLDAEDKEAVLDKRLSKIAKPKKN